MPKIKEIKKLKTKYQIYFDEEMVEIEPVIYMKYHLKLMQDIEIEHYKKIIDDNHYEMYKRIGLNRLKRVQTKHELYEFLIKKGAPIKIAKQLIYEFEEKRYLDDYQYTKMYVQLNQDQKGPQYIENKLVKKGVQLNLIKSFTSRINEAPLVDHLVEKKLKLLIGRKTKRQISQKLKTDLLRLGYSQSVIEQSVSRHIANIPEVDEDVLIKAYNQLRKKIKEDELDYEQRQKILLKLYQKGFSMDMIKKVIEKHS